MEETQKFQGRAQLFALQVHAVWEKLENVVLFPFRWLSQYVGQTDIFRQEEERLTLRRVK